jgi:NlpC/P60 family
LRGPSLRLDPRVNAYRGDIADVSLAGQIIASHYAAPLDRACGSRATFVRSEARDEGDAVSELLPGEGFAVLEYTGHWAWGYCTADHRVGFVETIELVDPVAATHVVCEAKVPVFADGSIGATRLACMPMGARLTGHEAGACLLSEVGCVPMSHVRRVGETESDPATVAMKLIGTKYLSGGRSHNGIDAAGLIQLALGQCGVCVPRDLDLQTGIGAEVAKGAPLKRGDIVIAGEEGGVMIDDLMLIHASRSAGKVAVEPVAVLETRHPGSVRRRVAV